MVFSYIEDIIPEDRLLTGFYSHSPRYKARASIPSVRGSPEKSGIDFLLLQFSRHLLKRRNRHIDPLRRLFYG